MKLIQTFTARDSSGHVYTLDVWQREIDASSLDHEDAQIKGGRRIMYGKFQATRIEQGHYKIPALRIELTSDDPAAP